MSGPQSAQPAAGSHPASREDLLILLAGSPSAAERALVTQWLRDGGIQPAAVLPLNGPGLARSLDQAVPETVVTAVRVAWLPRERGGERRVRWADVVSQVNPRRPPVFWQNRIMRREPDRARMVVAEPATVAALRARWGGTGSFAHFVSRQARLALDRSERALLGHRYKVPKEVTEAIVDSPDFRAEVARLADRLGLTEQEAMVRAEADLDSLVASMSPIAVDLLSSATSAARLRGMCRSTAPG
jgi:glycerol-3-phosphate O-acyltransferase